METATHDDCWENYLKFRNTLADKANGRLTRVKQRRLKLSG